MNAKICHQLELLAILCEKGCKIHLIGDTGNMQVTIILISICGITPGRLAPDFLAIPWHTRPDASYTFSLINGAGASSFLYPPLTSLFLL